MVILGLTGSIGMGKSEAAKAFRRMNVPVYDADAAVHRVMAKGGKAVAPVGEAFPGVIRDGTVDRAELGRRVFGDAAALRRLEAIIHPLVGQAQRRFLAAMARRQTTLVVLDIPLLLETGGNQRCDYVAVVSAPYLLQRQRVLRRPGMSPEKFAAVLAQQMPDREKRRRADFVIASGLNKRHSWCIIRRIVGRLSLAEGRVWGPKRDRR